MSDASADRGATPHGGGEPTDPVRYPTKHVVGVLDTQEQAQRAVAALTSNGFLDAEITVGSGAAAADRLDASTGRGGLTGVVTSIAEWLGVENDEMRLKERYEAAMREGRFVLGVVAPTEVRKERATQLLSEYGAHTVAYFDRYTIEAITPPKG